MEMTNKSDMAAKLESLLMDEEFSSTILKATSIKEIVGILHNNGIEATEEELQSCGEQAMAILKKDGYISEDGELSLELLDNVAGGKIGGKVMLAGVGMMGVALASDYLAGACAVALVSNPAGWFFGGAAVLLYGAYLVGKKR